MTGLPVSVSIREVGLRDGLQIEEPITTADKVRLLEALVTTGVKRMEVTAFVSPRAVPAMADADEVARYVRDRGGMDDIVCSALVANTRGAERAISAGITDLEYVVSAGDGHSRANANRTTTEALEAVADIATLAHSVGGRCEVIIATAWDCPFDGPIPPSRTTSIAARSVELGADQVCLGDTIGTTTPGRVVDLVGAVHQAIVGVPLGVHLHNTRGTGLASAWAAVTAGVTMIDASIAGLGGCPFAPGASGNIATEELVYMLENSGVLTGVDLASALIAARLAQQLVGNNAGSNLLRAGGPSVPLDTVA